MKTADPRAKAALPILAIGLLLLVGLAVFAIKTQESRSRPDEGERVEIARVVKVYERALLSGEGDIACGQLTTAARADLLRQAAQTGYGSSCTQVAQKARAYVESMLARAPSPERAAAARALLANPPVRVVSVTGRTAIARIAGTLGQPIGLAKDGGGRWRIASLPLRSAAP
jgi:hypothetical protein